MRSKTQRESLPVGVCAAVLRMRAMASVRVPCATALTLLAALTPRAPPF
jgi:hypothetical protein